jgi:glycosyltransferase involved in cell wall biosynthesis
LIRKHSNAKIIYFGHDLHYLREYRQYEIEKDPAILKSSNDWKKREFDLFNKADVIHVVGSYEQGILQQEFPNKPVRNIPVYIYDALKDSVNTDFKQRKDIIFVGGFGHPPNTDAVLWFAKEVFPSILDKYPDIKWYVVGSKVTDHVKALASDNIIITGFISDEELSDLYAKCRLAIVPLRVGAGVKGKVIEAVYNRIPLITTSIGAEGLSLKENAFIVSDGKDNMIRDINTLYENYEMLEQLSENSKAFIKNYFSVKTAKEVIAMDIEAK